MSDKLKQIMEEIGKLTITELNELIKSLEPIFAPEEEALKTFPAQEWKEMMNSVYAPKEEE